ncbi:MAG TPA: glycine oxidase ThiO [Longimicrobiaceae bacterium]|nr:glycine oxidase ThiO [Longimicrobiaceae bacterium]
MTGPVPDVVVVGGGVIGCAVARRAALGGLSVVVVERATPGAEASSAAAGMLSPLAEASRPGPFLDLLLHARSIYPACVAALREETGADVGYGDAGTLYLSLCEADDTELVERHAWQSAAGLGVERLTAEEARRLEAALNPAVRVALRFPGDHQVDNRLLAAVLWSAAARAGASFRLGAEAVSLVCEGGRAAGIGLTGGERIRAGAVVLAGGCWAGQMEGLPRPLPVHPARGQLLALESTPPAFRHVVDSPRCYLVPRADHLIAGSTVEDAGYHKAVTPWGLRQLMDGAIEIAPGLEHAPIASAWSGLRPRTPDGLPILGADPEMAGLFYATGHFRNGILLAPLTGELIGGMLLGISPSLDLAPYCIERFG